MNRARTALEIGNSWTQEPRWKGIARHYGAEDVVRLRGSVHIEHTLARRGAARLWRSLHERAPVRALGALTGHQAVQQVAAGLDAIYCSGWQVAGDANTAGQTYPDQSLYPVDSVPALVRRINRAFERADQIAHLSQGNGAGPRVSDWFTPIVDWVEKGQPPQRLVARKLDKNGTPINARPLCPYPQRAVYDGKGSATDAASFVCRAPQAGRTNQ